MPDFNRVPDAMKSYRQWVVWRYEHRGGEKPTKVPLSPLTAKLASVNDPETWGTFAEAVQVATQFPDQCNGIGFVLTEDDPFAFIDLDAPKPNATPEEIAAVTQRQDLIYNSFQSYAELSPSGQGLHIIVTGKLESGRKRGSVEVYSWGRYMTMTGDVYRNAPIADYNELLNELWGEMGAPRANQLADAGLEAPTQTDDELFAMALQAANGEKFKSLWDGHWQGFYHSQSEADFALVDILAFYSNNRQQVQRLFQASALGQREKGRRQDYVNYMLNRAWDNKLPPVDIEGLQNAIRAVLDRKAAEQTATIAETVKPETVLNPESIQVPGDDDTPYTLPPGLVGYVAWFIYQQAPRQVREIALAGALGLIAGIAGRAYNVSGTGLNQYILVLSDTGNGKEAISTGISKLMAEVYKTNPTAREFIGPGDLASGQALIKQLSKRPRFFSHIGEIGLRLEQMTGAKAAQHMIQFRRVLLDIYNKSGEGNVLAATAYSDTDKNTPAIIAPAVTIMGDSTPGTFYNIVDEQMIAEGFLPRFTVVEYRGERKYLNENANKVTPPEDLVQSLSTLCATCMGADTLNKPVNITLMDDAKAIADKFDKFTTDQINESKSEVRKQLWNRAHIKALKIAGTVAVGINFYKPVIDVATLNWAINLVLADVRNMLKRFEDGEVGSNTDEVQQFKTASHAFRDWYLRPWTELAGYAQAEEHARWSPLHSEKIVPYTFIHKRLARLAPFRNAKQGSTLAIKNTIRTLIERGDLIELPKPDMLKRFGTSATCYMVTQGSSLLA